MLGSLWSHGHATLVIWLWCVLGGLGFVGGVGVVVFSPNTIHHPPWPPTHNHHHHATTRAREKRAREKREKRGERESVRASKACFIQSPSHSLVKVQMQMQQSVDRLDTHWHWHWRVQIGLVSSASVSTVQSVSQSVSYFPLSPSAPLSYTREVPLSSTHPASLIIIAFEINNKQ